MSALRHRFLAVQAAIAPTSMHTRQLFRERARKHFPNRHLPVSGRMRRAGVWSSAKSSALRTIGEVLHRASSTSGGNRRVGRQRPGRKGGIGGPAATGLKFPTMQGRIDLPAPSGCESPYPRPAPLRRSPCPHHHAASRSRSADPVRARPSQADAERFTPARRESIKRSGPTPRTRPARPAGADCLRSHPRLWSEPQKAAQACRRGAGGLRIGCSTNRRADFPTRIADVPPAVETQQSRAGAPRVPADADCPRQRMRAPACAGRRAIRACAPRTASPRTLRLDGNPARPATAPALKPHAGESRPRARRHRRRRRFATAPPASRHRRLRACAPATLRRCAAAPLRAGSRRAPVNPNVKQNCLRDLTLAPSCGLAHNEAGS